MRGRLIGGRVSVPLLALLALVALVLVAALLRGLGAGGRALPAEAPDTGVARRAVGMEGSGPRVPVSPAEGWTRNGAGSVIEGWLL